MAPAKDKKIELIIVVSGEETVVDINPSQKVEHAIREALRLSGNEGRPTEEWELKREDGTIISPDVRAEEAGLHDGMRLFLSPVASAGG